MKIKKKYTVPLTNGFGSESTPDLALDPAVFVSDLEDGNEKLLYFLKLHLHHLSKKKKS
jgi:hypothetical protein